MPHEHESLYKALAAIGAILAMETLAILQGLDGVALAAAIGAVAGLGGFLIGKAASPASHSED